MLAGGLQQPIQTAVKILLVHDLEQHFLIRHGYSFFLFVTRMLCHVISFFSYLS